jgi:hypothetical protein
LLDEIHSGLPQSFELMVRRGSARIPPVGVEADDNVVAELRSKPLHEVDVSVRILSTLYLKRKDSIVDCGARFLEGFFSGHEPEHVRHWHPVTRLSAEEHVHGDLAEARDEVVGGDVQERLRVRMADEKRIEACRELAERNRACEKSWCQLLMDDGNDRGRRFAVAATVGIAPVAQSNDLSPAFGAAALDTRDDELAEGTRKREPTEITSRWQAKDKRLDALDRDPQRSASSITTTRFP